MWHGLRNDIIMRNVVYTKLLKEMRLFALPLFVSVGSFDRELVES